MLKTILLLLFGSVTLCYGLDDFEDSDLTLAKLRVERSDYSIGGPLAKHNNGTKKNVPCPMTVYPSSMLSDILWGIAKAPDYQLLANNSCSILSDCEKICLSLSCNYFSRFSTNGQTKFYNIKSEKLTSKKLSPTTYFDSYFTKAECGNSNSDGSVTQTSDSSGSGEDTSNNSLLANARQRFPRLRNMTNEQLREMAKQAFRRFMERHNRTYANTTDENKYFKIFQKGIQRIRELNAMKQNSSDAAFGETKFTDAPFSEFVKKFTGAVKNLRAAKKFDIDVTAALASLPKNYDWRDEGVVPDIRYQQECGSCYAFSTADLTAIQWAIDHKEKKSYQLAPQYVLDCIHGQAALGCDGGRPYLVLESNANCTGTKNCSWPRESCYRYQNSANKACKAIDLTCAQSDQPKIQVQRAYYLDVSGDGQLEKDRLSALLPGGPMVALVTVTDSWQYYTGGIIRASLCKNAGDPNHAVVVIGYNFTDPTSPHYIVRNTWDTDWGENGHFRIEAGSNACGIAKYLSFACTSDCGDGNQQYLLDRATKRLKNSGGSSASTAGTVAPKQGTGKISRSTKRSVEDRNGPVQNLLRVPAE